MRLEGRTTLYERLERVAERNLDAPALTFLDAHLKPTCYTYRCLLDRSSAIAKALAIEIRELRSPIGILLQSQEAQVLHYLATLSLGHVPAILTPPNRKLNLAYFIENTRAVLARCGFGALISDLAVADLSMTILEPFTLHKIQRGPAEEDHDMGNAALLQFSSGTTGLKRGVLVTHEAALRQLSTYARAIDLNQNDRIVSWLPLYHDMGLMACLNMPLVHGIHSIMLEPLDWVANPCSYLRAVSIYQATLGWNPNFAYAFMADRTRPQDLRDLDLSSLRGLVNCSEAVTWESQQRFLTKFTPVGLRSDVFLGCYAMAETTFALTHGRSCNANSLDHEGPLPRNSFKGALPLVSTGRALPGVELKVVNSEGVIVPDRHLGEILVRSPFDFAGYYNDEEATAAAFVDGWYKTGDVGYFTGEELFVCGRSKDILIVGGVNIFPHDIEEMVSRINGVVPGRVVAFSQFDANVQTERVIVLAESEIPPGEQSSVVIQIRQRMLAAFQIANFEVHLVPTGWLTKSSSGKMARRANQTRWIGSDGQRKSMSNSPRKQTTITH